MKKNLNELEKEYDLELDKIANQITKTKAKKVLLQFPDAFKPYATEIQDKLEELLGKYRCEFFIWLDTCFGACDLPLEAERAGVDLIVQFGHSKWHQKFE